MAIAAAASTMTSNNSNEEKKATGDDDDDQHDHDMVMPGFRFHPTDEELVEFYLRRKVEDKPFNVDLITFLDLYRYDPWELPGMATIGEKEWFFYVPRDRKYRNGDRPNRVTTSGYWKATGADRVIRGENSRTIGLKKSLVFYSGKAPKGIRSTWIMNEYRLPHHDTERYQKVEISLCRVYRRPGVEDSPSSGHLPRAFPSRGSASSSTSRHRDQKQQLSISDIAPIISNNPSPTTLKFQQSPTQIEMMNIEISDVATNSGPSVHDHSMVVGPTTNPTTSYALGLVSAPVFNPSTFSTCTTAAPITNNIDNSALFSMSASASSSATSTTNASVVDEDLHRLVDFQYYPQIHHHSSTITTVHGINYSALIMPMPQHRHPYSSAHSLTSISPSITNPSSMATTTSAAFSDRQWDWNALHETTSGDPRQSL